MVFSNKGSVAVEIGRRAPDFALWTDSNQEWRLSDHQDGVTVLLFYPQNETLVCTKQLCSLRDNWAGYLATKATIVGISPGTPDDHRRFSEKKSLPIPLLADPDRAITRIYGLHWLFPVNLTRAVVVIDAKGIIRNRDVMLRAFRPSDDQLITDIYAARGDALNEQYNVLKRRFSRTGKRPA
ncbi:MAG: peroxiredoxin [Acidobacteria bacterium]|nr:peroxiredoxin [Acidobacteriota bacterium]